MAHLAHYREAHPLPMRITHWINLSCMVLLIFSGFLIHFPFWAALTGVARGVHVFCGLVLLFNCIVPWIKYYLFMKKDHPLSAKLGVPQKISYFAVGILILIMAYTGLCLWVPTSEWTFFAAGTAFVGGAMSMRIIHYFMMFVFIIFTMLHGYLVFIEGTANANLMFFGKEHGGLVYDPNRHVIVGEAPFVFRALIYLFSQGD